MPYDDDDDLFEEFDFVDDDDDAEDEKTKEEPKPKPRRGAPRNDKAKAEKPPARGPKRAKPAASGGKRAPRRNDQPAQPTSPPSQPIERAPVGYLMDDEPFDDEEPMEADLAAQAEPQAEADPPAPSGPPADHVVHIYEYGVFKRTIPRKFTDEEAVGFAEEFTRTGKVYGRYAIATPQDEEPARTFTAAGKG